MVVLSVRLLVYVTFYPANVPNPTRVSLLRRQAKATEVYQLFDVWLKCLQHISLGKTVLNSFHHILVD